MGIKAIQWNTKFRLELNIDENSKWNNKFKKIVKIRIIRYS